MSETQVLIVGAGPSGLVLALWLARAGIAFRIISAAGGPGHASRAMAVQARTLEFYQQLGISEEVVARGIKMRAIRLREGDAEVARVDFEDIGKGLGPFPFVLSFPQDDHERLLNEQLVALGIAVEWGVTLRDFSPGESGVSAILERDGVEEICEAGWLCGCDGAHSTVRKRLGLEFPGGTYEQLFYVADVRVDGPPSDDITATLFANGLALRFPVRSSGMQRLIGIVPPDLAGRAGLSFADFQARAEAQLGIRVAGVNWFSTYHVGHRVVSSFRAGRCFLVGDAAHIHSPAGGQGMNTGIGDAVNLAWKLAEVLRGRAAATLLDSYDSERIGFARQLVATTDRVFENAVDPGFVGELLRTRLVPRLLPLATRFAATRRIMFRTVSQVRISYPTSPLSEGIAGRVRGGDRLPWIAAEGASNFAPLAALDWQVHVYGAATPDFAAAATRLGLPLHTFAWSTGAASAGFSRDAAYLLRPDGHVALALPEQRPEALAAYAGARGLRWGQRHFP